MEADGFGLASSGVGRSWSIRIGETVRLVGGGGLRGAHLVKAHGVSALGELPGGFGPREAATDDVDHSHRPNMADARGPIKRL